MHVEASKRLQAARYLDRAGKHEEALDAFRSFLEEAPDATDVWVDYAGLLMVLGRLDEAEEACARALKLDPRHYGARVHAACVQMHRGFLDVAERQFLEAVAMDPRRIAGRLLYSDCLARKGELDRARDLLEKVLEQEPGKVAAMDRLNTIMARQRDWPGLRKDMARQVALYSGAEAEYVAGQLDLMFGDMPRGWQRYESRLEMPGRGSDRSYARPRWRGEPFVHKTLLLTWEQGFGDTLMFLRFAPLAKALGGRVLLEVQPPLAELAATCPGIDEVYVSGHALPPFDFHASLLSLPFLFRTNLETIPADIPYLGIPALVPDQAAINAAMNRGSDRVRVGVCWAGNPMHARNAKRSIPSAALAPLGAIPGVAWYNFQVGVDEEAPLPGVLALGPLLSKGGFPNTAYALSRMDLVITVDTVIAHLAAALGIPTLLLLSFIPDWRWMLGRDDSPWYPTMHLYRQPSPGDWDSVLRQIVQDLTTTATP